jgi:MFS family permease
MLSFFALLIGSAQGFFKKPLLLNEDYFNLDNNKATQISTDATNWGTIPAFILTISMGFVFEILGRKYVLLAIMLFTAVFIYLTPLTAPNVNMYIAVSILEGMFTSYLLISPLIQDYVEIESRGKALSFAMLGITTGMILAQ